jgi:two-component system, sensor histidine kinase and response regulator
MERSAISTPDNARLQSVWALPEELQQLARDGGADVVVEVIEIFQEDTAARLEKLQEAIRNGNCASIRAEGHALKGSSSQLGAAAMARMCFQMEQMGSSENIAGAAALLAEIQQHFGEVNQAMSKLNLGDASYDG